MEYKIQSRSPKMRHYVETLMPSLIKQLKLENSRKFVLIEIAKGITMNGAYGATTPLPGLDSFVIALTPRPWADLGCTLAHEMVHVKQFAKGHLRSEDGKTYWKGQRVMNRVKYLDQPWELEAFAKQEILFRRALESINV
jgi:hypothetical protein